MGIADDLAAYIASATTQWDRQVLESRFWCAKAATYIDLAVTAVGAGEEVQASIYSQLALVCAMAREAADIERPPVQERGVELLPHDIPEP